MSWGMSNLAITLALKAGYNRKNFTTVLILWRLAARTLFIHVD